MLRVSYLIFRSSLVSLAVFVGISTSAGAVELWSTDLWGEPSKQEVEAPGGSSTDPDGMPGVSPPPLAPSGTGLWSEQLWSTPPSVKDPEPTTPSTPPAPLPQTDQPGTAQPNPTQPNPTQPQPSLPLPLPSDGQEQGDTKIIVVMQIGSTDVLVRGREMQLPVPPSVINGRTMVPLRFIGEAMEASFTWEPGEKKITVQLNDTYMEIWIGKTAALVNGREVVLDTPALTLNGVTLVPIRFISEQFGYDVSFESATRTIKIRELEAATPAPDEGVTKPETGDAPEAETAPSTASELAYPYIGEWVLHMDGRSQGMPMGSLTVHANGTYSLAHGVSGQVQGKWRIGEENEVIGIKAMLILEKGPGGADWAMIPKTEDIVSVRYHYGYSGDTKIWFEDSLGIRITN